MGDWVTLDPQIDFDLINERLPRYSTLGRITGEEFHAQEKDSASNIDQLFICFSMNKNLKSSRINRFLYALEKESQVTKGYLDQKLAKKLNKKAEFKKATINYHHYRKPPM